MGTFFDTGGYIHVSLWSLGENLLLCRKTSLRTNIFIEVRLALQMDDVDPVYNPLLISVGAWNRSEWMQGALHKSAVRISGTNSIISVQNYYKYIVIIY